MRSCSRKWRLRQRIVDPISPLYIAFPEDGYEFNVVVVPDAPQLSEWVRGHIKALKDGARNFKLVKEGEVKQEGTTIASIEYENFRGTRLNAFRELAFKRGNEIIRLIGRLNIEVI